MIQLTELAAKKVKQQLSNRGKGIGISVGVRTTGCSGLAYKLEYVDQDLLPKIINNPKLHRDLYVKNLQKNAREYSNFYKTSTSIIPKVVEDENFC